MKKMNDKPNIFSYATKELSQDAVICWLIKWAGRQDVDVRDDAEAEALRDCGRRFVKALLAEHEPSLDPDIKEIEILQQDNKIDVLARINGPQGQVLLIEDKTSTSDHSEQLKRYYKAVVEGKTGLGEVCEENLYPIFFKTGNQSRGQDDVIEKKRVETGKEYKVFNRKEFLEVLNHYKGSNPILLDFRAYLQEWEDDTNSFKDWKEEERTQWSKYAWQGFLRHIEEEFINCMREGWWGYVSNPAGGFWGFSWDFNGIEKEEAVYLQLEIVPGEPEEQKLCFKVRVDNKENRNVARNKWHKWCMAAVAEVAGIEATKPKRFGAGKHMTVVQWGKEGKERGTWLAFDSDSRLDKEATVANLKKAEAVLAKAIEMERQGGETQS